MSKHMKTHAYTPTELRKALLQRVMGGERKAIHLTFTGAPYFTPEIVSKLIDEIEIKATMKALELDEFTNCERMIYRLLCESAELVAE